MKALDVLDEAHRRLPASLELLRALVETNSHASNDAGIAGCQRQLRPHLAELGFRLLPRTVSVPDPRDATRTLRRTHLWAERTSPRPGAPTVLLLGHLDTVFLPEHPFRALQRDGERWRGPGVADMKGGLVTALLTLELLRSQERLDDATWRVLFVSDEEEGSPTGSEVLRAAGEGLDLAICFEAARDDGELVVGRKGLGVAEVRAYGKTGHAGIAHDRNPNALTALARFLVAAEALEKRHDGLSISPGGPVRVSPEAVNLIPSEARCELEWRFFDRAVGDSVVLALGEIAASLVPARVEVRVLESTPPMAAADPELVERYLDAASQLGLRSGAVRTSGVGDINLVAGGGAACIDGAGPEGGGFHTDAEFVRVASIAERAAMNTIALGGRLADGRIAGRLADGRLAGRPTDGRLAGRPTDGRPADGRPTDGRLAGGRVP